MTPLGVIVLIVLVDLLGFTLVMPLLGPFAEQYGFRGLADRLLVLGVSGLPARGRSDPGPAERSLWPQSALDLQSGGDSPLVLDPGLSHNFSVMLLARMLDGASGGNILVAQAYVADVTEPEHRARGMGLIGMAFGLGFVLGPLLGGPASRVAAGRRMAATPAVPGRRGFLDARLGAGALSGCPSRGLG